MLHGSVDGLVPARQSVRLCNMFSGSPDTGPAREDAVELAGGVYRTVFASDYRGSYLHLLGEAGHDLDVCIGGAICPAGGSAGQSAAHESFRDALQWLGVPDPAESMGVSNAGGSARTGCIFILWLLACAGASRSWRSG
ncbi:MAG: hypothetical protein OET44_17070 [Gammaproteobacteria bacterium]|nr:hypothetical protein [Gammaproteobacteria bacterium]